MSIDLEELRDSLSLSLEQLLAERDDAVTRNDTAKITVAETEADRLGVVLATVQFAINNQQALNMNAVAKRLQDSVEAQRAIGLRTAAQGLEDVITKIGDGQQQAGGGGGGPAQTGGLQAKPGKKQFVIDKLIGGAVAAGIDPMGALTIVSIESDFDPTNCSRLSSAAGLFQFIDSTWAAVGGKKFAGRGGVGNGQAAGASVDIQVQIGCKFVADLISDLSAKLGSAPSLTATYMAHQQGIGGALKILQADPNAPIESVIGVAAAHNNAFDGLTVAQTTAKFNTMVRSHGDEVAALVTRVAAPAGGGGGAVAGGGGGDAGGSGRSIAPKLVQVALSEMETFARRGDGSTVTETQSPLAARVLEYFRLVGRGDITDPSAEPWSAAFISFVMRNAGAAPAQFPISENHAKYILAGLANRIANRLDASVVYFDRGEIAPRVGDLIGFSRTGEVRNRADMERFLPDKFFPAHTDAVLDVSPGKLKVIGGNVSQTILSRTVRTDGAGKIDPADEHFFVLRMNI